MTVTLPVILKQKGSDKGGEQEVIRVSREETEWGEVNPIDEGIVVETERYKKSWFKLV